MDHKRRRLSMPVNSGRKRTSTVSWHITEKPTFKQTVGFLFNDYFAMA